MADVGGAWPDVTDVRLLCVLRHAKSSWEEPFSADQDRPLAPRGRKDMDHMAAHIRSTGLAPELVLCSSARRTRETLERLRPALPRTTTVLVEDRIYAASADELLDRIREVPAEVNTVLLIGHNPGAQELVAALAGKGSRLRDVRDKFPTGALATLDLGKRSWSQLREGGAELRAFVAPRELR